MSDSAPTSPLKRSLPWLARIAWLATAVGGAAIESAVDERSTGLRWVAGVGAWALWGTVLVALLIPSVISLAWVRVVGPLSLVVVGATAVGGAPAGDLALLAVPALVACFVFFSPEFGRWMVQASAYGDEDRLLLRSPVPVGAAALVSWLVWASTVVTGPLALGAANWVLGVPATLVAVALTIYVGPRWLLMARRWLVLVPAGLVVHDPIVLADTLMIKTNQLASMGLARADTQAADLTGPASGHALQINTSETVSTVFAFTPSEPNGRAIHMTGFLIAPSRPGEALQLAAARGLPIN